MKNFLKSTAIFACIALLFCVSCETDDTETGAGTAPQGISFSPGANRALVSWNVPEDSDVEGYSVTWKDSNGNSSKTSLIKVEGSTEAAVTQLSEIPAGVLTATLNPLSGSGGSTTLTTTVYDASTYAEKIPTIYGLVFDSTNITAEIEWGSIDMDCFEIEVSYTDVYGEEIETGRLSVDENVLLSNIQAGDSISCIAYYCPAGGLDEVKQVFTTGLDTAPYAPTDVSVSVGVRRIVAEWVLDFTESDEEEDEEEEEEEETTTTGRPGMTHQELVDSLKAEITGTIIRCVNTRTSEVTLVSVPMSEHTDSLNNYEVALAPADYEVSVFTLKESGATSSVVDATFEVTVYSELDYLNTDSFQASIASTGYEASTGLASIYWDSAPAHSTFIGVEVTYVGFSVIATEVYEDVTDDDGNVTTELTGYDYSVSTTETSTQTSVCEAITADSATATYVSAVTENGDIFYNAIANEQFSYASCFCPDGGLDTVRIYSYNTPTASANSESFVFVEEEPLTAESVVVTTGFTTDEEGVETSYITAVCSISDITDIISYVVDVTVDGEVDESLSTVYTAVDIELDADLGYYIITHVVDDVKVGSTYEVSVTSVTASFTEGVITSDPIVPYNTATYSDLAPEVTATCDDASTVTVTWVGEDFDLYDDISNIAVLYGNQSSDYSLSQLKSGISLMLLSQDLVRYLYYTVTYTPDSGETSVTMSKEAVLVIVNPTAPASVDVTSGYYTSTDAAYIDVNVDILDVSNVKEFVVDVSCNGVVTEGYQVFASQSSYPADGISFRIEDVTVGAEYVVSCYAITEDGGISTSIASNTIVPYNTTTYSAVPSVYAENSYSNVVIATWSNIDTDLTEIVINYGSKTYSDFTYSDITGFVELEDTTVPSTFTYTISYCPSTGTVPVEVTQSASVVVTPISYDIVLSEDVYEIYSGEGLAAFAAIVNGTENTNADLKFSGVEFTGEAVTAANAKVMNNISLSDVCSAASGVNWTPIASATAFTGTFDGNDKIISKLYISSETTYQALFGYISGATVKNVIMDSPNVSGTSNISALVGNAASSSVIENCYITGTGFITATSNNNGCIVGYSNASVVKNCHVGSGITIYGVSTGTGNGGAGGIAGAAVSGSYVAGCTNAGAVTCKGRSGGIVGYSAGVYIVGCGNTGSVTDITGSTGNIGGIAGRFIGGTVHFIGCYNTGTITSNNKDQTSGIMGVSTSTITMAGCYNIGDVNAGTATSNIGALKGYNGGTYTFSGDYYVPTENMSWAAVSSSTEDPEGTYQVESIAALNGVVDEMNAAIIAAGYDSSSDYYYQYTAGATSTDYPTISEAK